MPNPTEQAARSLVETLRGVLLQVAEPTAVLRSVLELAVSQTGAQRGLFVEVAAGGDLTFQVLHGFQPNQLEGEAGKFSRNLCVTKLPSRRNAPSLTTRCRWGCHCASEPKLCARLITPGTASASPSDARTYA